MLLDGSGKWMHYLHLPPERPTLDHYPRHRADCWRILCTAAAIPKTRAQLIDCTLTFHFKVRGQNSTMSSTVNLSPPHRTPEIETFATTLTKSIVWKWIIWNKISKEIGEYQMFKANIWKDQSQQHGNMHCHLNTYCISLYLTKEAK